MQRSVTRARVITCAALLDPLDTSIQFTIKWKTVKPTPKLLDTTAPAASGDNSTDDTTGAQLVASPCS